MSQLHIYNTLTRQLEPFVPMTPGQVRMYVCGMTTYDYCHIGHARAMMTFDVVYRWLKARGYDVTYVRNHTDVDDKIIARANELGEHPLDLSARFIGYLDEDLAAIGLEVPTHQPRVSEYIPEIVAMIQQLLDKGHAYVSDGDVYFSVETDPDYGKLSGRRREDLREGDQGDSGERKRSSADFALWKGVKPGELDASWETAWGRGRPGWHIECSAMAARLLGETFDIHGGGIDLVFPHHENEIAQSECATGHKPFARTWMHNGHLTLEHTKMSKSLGNVVRIRDIVLEVPAEALRVLYLDSQYRSPLLYSSAKLEEAMVALDRLYQARETLLEMAEQPEGDGVSALVASFGAPAAELAEAVRTFDERFQEAMDDDFNTALALGCLHELARAANRLGNVKKARKRASVLAKRALAAMDMAGRVLGIGHRAPAEYFQEVRQKLLKSRGVAEADVEAAVAARWQARAAKDWAEADRVRDELVALGVVLMDGADGTTWRMRVGGEAA